MWCSQCQQDVPAVVRCVQGPLLCTQCEHEVGEPLVSPESRPVDTGVSLDSFDASQATAEQELASPISDLQREQSNERQRRIDRQLHRSYHSDLAVDLSPGLRESVAPVPPSMYVKATYQRLKREPKSEANSWLLSFLLGVGVLAFFAGVGLLAWSTAFQLPEIWQHGMTLTIGAEGLLILSLTWMAARLWHNSRRVNRQLHDVDQQLAEIEQIANTLAGSQQASSQHFYHHASQAASPHLLVANLQGQVDLMAARMAVEP